MNLFRLRRLVAVLLGVCALASVSRAQGNNTPSTPFRLPADVAAPIRYRVDLTIVPDQDLELSQQRFLPLGSSGAAPDL
jgi:hypothetical protein